MSISVATALAIETQNKLMLFEYFKPFLLQKQKKRKEKHITISKHKNISVYKIIAISSARVQY